MKTVFYTKITFLFIYIFSACSSSELLFDKTDVAPFYSEEDSRKYLPELQSKPK